MSDMFSNNSLRTLFKFPFQSPNWKNRFLIGSGLLVASFVIPFVPAVFVYGYMIRVMRQAIQGESVVLPEWNEWGQLAKDGLRGLVVGLIYMAPGTIVMIAGWLIYMVLWVGGMFLVTDNSGSDPSSGLFIVPMFVSMAILFISMFLGWLLTMLGLVPFPAALAHFVARDRVSAALSIREWSGIIKADKWGYLISWVVTIGLGGILYFAFMMVYFIGIFCFPIFIVGIPVGQYLFLVAAAVFGQFYRESTSQYKEMVAQPKTESI